MTSFKRFGNRWTINECLQLEREFDLLELSIDEMAQRHQRTPNAIMLKLDSEGHADYNVLYSNYHALNTQIVSQTKAEEEEDEDEDEDYESDADTLVDDVEAENNSLKQQVLNLEKKVNELSDFIMKQNKGSNVFSLFS
jgi:uncharacterized protein YlxW (UPF0749 family)